MKSLFLSKLEEICSDLIYVSETDSAVNPFYSEKVSSLEENLKNEQIVADTTEFDATEFLNRKARFTDKQTPKQRKFAQKFSEIRDILEQFGGSVKGLKSGEIAIIYYIFSQKEDEILGVYFNAVET